MQSMNHLLKWRSLTQHYLAFGHRIYLKAYLEPDTVLTQIFWRRINKINKYINFDFSTLSRVIPFSFHVSSIIGNKCFGYVRKPQPYDIRRFLRARITSHIIPQSRVNNVNYKQKKAPISVINIPIGAVWHIS